MRTIPLEINSEDKILVISPHPDDESIGVGGLLLMYGKQCSVVVMTDGRYGNPRYKPLEMARVRKREFHTAMILAGVSVFRMMEYEDGKLINHSDAFSDLRIDDYNIVLVPNPNDNHSDHTACYSYVLDYIKDASMKDIKVYMYEVHTPLSDVDYHIDITDYIFRKKDLVGCYESQMEIHPYSEQVVKLAGYRGCQNEKEGRFLEVYKKVEFHGTEKLETGIEKELSKYKLFTKLFVTWISCDNNVGNIAEYLQNRNCTDIAIYGFGILGKILYNQLKGTNCNVKYIVDVNENIVCDIPIYHDLIDIEPVNLIVVTVLLDSERVVEQISKIGIQSISFEQLIDEIGRE